MIQEKKARRLVPTVQRTFEVLEALSTAPNGYGVSELSRDLKLAKSTTHSILATLEALGYVYKPDDNGRYQMTLKLFSLGGNVVDGMDLRQVASPALRQLVEATGEAANLGTIQGDEAVYIECIHDSHPVTVRTWPGERLSLHSTALGKALLAWLAEDEVEAILLDKGLESRTPNTITSQDGLRAELKRVRESGYAMDNEEEALGMCCIGAPIRDYSQNVIAAISLTAPTQRLSAAKFEQTAALVVDCAERVSRRLGYSSRQDS